MKYLIHEREAYGMKIVLIYISPNKTTQLISKELSKQFIKAHHEVVELNIGEKENRDLKNIDMNIFRDTDLIGIGSPVYQMKILRPLSDFLDSALPGIKSLNKDVKAFVYLTYGGTTTGKSFMNMVDPLRRNNIKVIGGFKVCAPHFWHTENYPYDESIKTINDFYSAVTENKFTGLEWGKVEKMFSYQKLIINAIYPFMGAILKLRGMPAIQYDNSKCIKCKKCFNECPASAIKMNDYPARNVNTCIYCYHCAMVCPKGAITFSMDEVKKRIVENKRIIGLEQPENAIYISAINEDSSALIYGGRKENR